MLHFMKYRFLISIRKKEELFWTLVFPLLLATIFHFAFSGLSDMEQFQAIPVAVVKHSEVVPFDSFIDEMDDTYLEVQFMKEEEAIEALEVAEITGIYYSGNTPSLTVSVNDAETMMLKSILDIYNQNASILASIGTADPSQVAVVSEEMAQQVDYLKQHSFGNEEQDLMMPYFFALIGMATLFGWTRGLEIATAIQANLSAVAARKSIAITKKIPMILGEIMVAVILQFTALVGLVLYMIFVLQLPVKVNAVEMGTVLLAGSFLGVCIGLAVGSIGTLKADTKNALLVGVSTISAFLAGLMLGTMPAILEASCPLINRINPATLIAKAIYSIATYPDATALYTCIVGIVLWCVLLITFAVCRMRRAQYDSI